MTLKRERRWKEKKKERKKDEEKKSEDKIRFLNNCWSYFTPFTWSIRNFLGKLSKRKKPRDNGDRTNRFSRLHTASLFPVREKSFPVSWKLDQFQYFETCLWTTRIRREFNQNVATSPPPSTLQHTEKNHRRRCFPLIRQLFGSFRVFPRKGSRDTPTEWNPNSWYKIPLSNVTVWKSLADYWSEKMAKGVGSYF